MIKTKCIYAFVGLFLHLCCVGHLSIVVWSLRNSVVDTIGLCWYHVKILYGSWTLPTFLQDVGSGTFGNDVDYSVIFTQTTNIALLPGH